jgi:hypothetical protein
MLQIVMSLNDNSRGICYNHNIFIIQTGLIFKGKGSSLPYRGDPEKSSTRVGSGNTCKYFTRLERLDRDKCSSLFVCSVSDKE